MVCCVHLSSGTYHFSSCKQSKSRERVHLLAMQLKDLISKFRSITAPLGLIR